MSQLKLPSSPVAIALEGVDGCGKTTQVSCLSEAFTAISRPHIQTRQPGGSDTLNIRNILLNAPDICSKARHLLFAADNAQHTHDTIRPALATGSDVLLDRCIGSAYAYQGWGEGFGMERVRISYDWATDNFKPDLTVFFDMNPVEVITRREINDEQIEEDVIEKFGIDFQWRVYEGYHSLVDHEDGWVCIRTPPTLTIVETTELLVGVINERLSG